jgi:hypothetical protein
LLLLQSILAGERIINFLRPSEQCLEKLMGDTIDDELERVPDNCEIYRPATGDVWFNLGGGQRGIQPALKREKRKRRIKCFGLLQ